MKHLPVLLHEVVTALEIEQDDVLLDATLGQAGHARAMAQHLSDSGTLIGIDADELAIEDAEKVLSDFHCKKILIHENFVRLHDIIAQYSLPRFDAVLFDLGWGTHSLSRKKGFSFLERSEPLLMTYGSMSVSGVTARDILNDWSEETIALIFKQYGGEGRSSALARQVIYDRARAPFLTVGDLLDTVSRVIPKKTTRVHPATKVFQALRIAVNNELGIIPGALDAVVSHMNTGARLAVITFHGTEDLVVKRSLKAMVQAGRIGMVTKHVVKASRAERLSNPRSRSAQLRVCIKI